MAAVGRAEEPISWPCPAGSGRAGQIGGGRAPITRGTGMWGWSASSVGVERGGGGGDRVEGGLGVDRQAGQAGVPAFAHQHREPDACFGEVGEPGVAELVQGPAAEIFTTVSGGWTLHQLRHSRLTHLAEAGVGLPMLMHKSRHTSLASLAIYAKPTFDAVAAATAALDPDRRR